MGVLLSNGSKHKNKNTSYYNFTKNTLTQLRTRCIHKQRQGDDKMKSIEKLSDVLTPEEVGEVLRLPTEDVMRLLESDDIPGIKVGTVWRILKQNLIDLLHPQEKKYESTSFDSSLNGEIKIGELVRQTMTELLESSRLPSDVLEKLKTLDYSNQIFGINFPLLKDYDPNKDLKCQKMVRAGDKEYPRYWKTIFSEKYLITSEWNIKHKKRFVDWAKQF